MCKILLVEDDSSTRSLLTKILSKEGFEIIEASDGEEGLKLYEKVMDKPEVIILDYNLPKMNGLKLAQEIRSRNPSSKVLIITGDPRFNKQIADNMNIRLRTKPITKEDLINEIDILRAPVVEIYDDFSFIYPGRNREFVQEDEIGTLLKLHLS